MDISTILRKRQVLELLLMYHSARLVKYLHADRHILRNHMKNYIA